MNLPTYLTPMLRDRLQQIAAAVELRATREQCEVMMGMTDAQMASTMFRLFGASTWPPVIDPKLWTLPIESPPPPTTGGRRVEKKMSDEDIAARVARDQGRRREEREQWLDREQQRYGLKRRGRSIDDMPA